MYSHYYYLSVPSHKSSTSKKRPVQPPQRSNGKLRVAAILEAAEAVIAEKGYEAATMAEIASRSGTKIGSLYRFFPNKESLADTMVACAREDLNAAFDQFNAKLSGLSVRTFSDELLSLLFEPVFKKPALMKLLDAGPNWSSKRDEFRSAVLHHIANTVIVFRPNISRATASDIALVILLNIKAASTHTHMAASALGEFRDMVRLYVETRLRRPKSEAER